MKLSQLLVAGLCFASVSAFAQTASNDAQKTQPSSTANANVYQQADVGGWVSPDSPPVHEKTRAEVYQELVQAEKDGQLQYLNSTLYAH